MTMRAKATFFVLLAVLLVLLIAPAPTLAWPGPPAAKPPRVRGAAGPPPAWLETPTRSVWLAYSSYCWKTTCADYLPPQSRTDLPVVSIRRGATVRVHFGFVPSEVHATTFVGTALRHAVLPPAKITRWQPRLSGVASLDVRAAKGSASYVLRVRVT